MGENNEKNTKKTTSIIRTILCVVVMAIIVLGWLEIIPDSVSIIIAAVVLCGVSVWNGAEALKEGRKGAGIVNMVAAGILVLLCIASLFL
ncbi:MAG: hypothetical protein ACI4JB_11210 [Porcipelethomonas sp.]